MKKIKIIGVIGDEYTESDTARELDDAGGAPVEIWISSPGGDAYESYAIHNRIKTYEGKTSVVINGLAASAASYIALAGDDVRVFDNSIYMIHNPWLVAIGGEDEMTKAGRILSRTRETFADAYASRSGGTRQEMFELMDAETYLYGGEIIDAGFADVLIENKSKKMTGKALNLMSAKAMVHEAYARYITKQYRGISLINSDKKNVTIKGKEVEIREVPEEAKQEVVEQPAAAIQAAMTADPAAHDMVHDMIQETENPSPKMEGNLSIKNEPKSGAGTVAGERTRVSSLMAFAAADPQNHAVRRIVDEAILSGASASEITPSIYVAMRDFRPANSTPKVVATMQGGGRPQIDQDLGILLDQMGITREQAEEHLRKKKEAK